MKKIVISAALTGSGRAALKAGEGARPITPDQIAADVAACAKAGAAVCHIHARDAQGKGTMDLGVFTEIYEKIQAALKAEGLDCVINLTTSGGVADDDGRVAHLKALRPEMCSYDVGTINWFNDSVFMNSPRFLKMLGTVAQEYGVKPEIEIFDTHMIKHALRYAEEGYLAAPLHFQLVLGTYGGMSATLENFTFLRSMLPPDSTFSVTGIGPASVPMMMLALASGADGVRVGLEDNLYMSKGVLATNVSQVERAVQFVKLAGFGVATPAEAREIFHIPPR